MKLTTKIKNILAINGLELKNYLELQKNKEAVLIAVKGYSCALVFASEELKTNKKVVIEAVKKNGIALQFASYELRNDEELNMLALKNL